MAEVVTERDGLGQLLVQPQHLGDAARDLRDLERVRQARPVVIAGRREEHLRLVLQPAKGLAVNDAVAVALEHRANRIRRLVAQAAAAGRALGGRRRQEFELALLEMLRGWMDMRRSRRATSVYRRMSRRKLVP